MAKRKSNKGNPVFEGGTISTVFGQETDFNGILNFKKSLQINGKFEGEIDSTGFLVIAPGARVKANIKARHIIIGGQVTGNVEADEKLELQSTAELVGNIKTKKLTISDGAVFQGNCERLEEEKVPATT